MIKRVVVVPRLPNLAPEQRILLKKEMRHALLEFPRERSGTKRQQQQGAVVGRGNRIEVINERPKLGLRHCRIRQTNMYEHCARDSDRRHRMVAEQAGSSRLETLAVLSDVVTGLLTAEIKHPLQIEACLGW